MYPALLAVVVAGSLEPSGCPQDREYSRVLAHAETSLGAGMPQYVFCVFGSAEGRSAWLHSLEAYDKNTGQRVAELPYPKEFAEGLGLVERSLLQGQPKFEDFNFDGYMDVSLLSFVGATGNSGANVWIYDSGSGEFVYERLLSQRKLKVHPERQEITSSWNGGHAGMIYGRDTIRWVDGEAAVVRSESAMGRRATML